MLDALAALAQRQGRWILVNSRSGKGPGGASQKSASCILATWRMPAATQIDPPKAHGAPHGNAGRSWARQFCHTDNASPAAQPFHSLAREVARAGTDQAPCNTPCAQRSWDERESTLPSGARETLPVENPEAAIL